MKKTRRRVFHYDYDCFSLLYQLLLRCSLLFSSQTLAVTAVSTIFSFNSYTHPQETHVVSLILVQAIELVMIVMGKATE